jgi:hypothetical protein
MPGPRRCGGSANRYIPGGSPAELAECHLHEVLLNVAFDASTPLWLLCPCDLEALAGDVIDGAHRTHLFAAWGEDRQACSTFRPIDLADPFARPLPARPADAAYLAFQSGGLGPVRTFVAERTRQAGLDQEPARAIVRAVNEIAANSLRHVGGQGELRAWTDNRSLICEVSDHGHITSPLAGRLPPTPMPRPEPVSGSPTSSATACRSTPGPVAAQIRLHQNL